MDESFKIYVFATIGCVGVLLQIAVIYFMSRSALPRYWGVLVYLLVLFLTSVCDMAAYINPEGYPDWYLEYWRLNNFLRHLSGFVAVISLIFIGTARHPARTKLCAASLIGTAVVIALSLLLPEATAGETSTRVGRDLSFTTIVLNVILWSSLIKTRHQDLRLFLVSGGLGVNMTGEAIAQSLWMMGLAGPFATLLGVGTHLLCLAIWLRAFRMAVAVDKHGRGRSVGLPSDASPESQFAPHDARS